MAKTSHARRRDPQRTIGLYKSYSFRNKDPIIDMLRTACAPFKYEDIEEKSGVSRRTLWNWFHGTTISPRYCTVAAVVRGLGIIARIGEYPKGRGRG